MKRIVFGLVIWLAMIGVSHAQTRQALVVASCPGSSIWTAGHTAPLTVDLTGALCTSGSSSGGGTSSAFDAAFPANGTAIGISDGTNMKFLAAAIALGDGVNGNNTAAVANWLYNGTTFDRARGDATNGAWVNVKTSALPTGAATETTLNNLLTAVQGPIAAGTNIIGQVGIDQTTDGTTNKVSAAQNGTWTVQPGNTANTTPWLVSGGVYNVTLPTLSDGASARASLSVNGGLLIGTVAAQSDGRSNSAMQINGVNGTSQSNAPVGVYSYGYNGSSWDRLRLAGSTLGLLTENGPYLLGRATADTQIKASAGFIHTISIAPLTATPTAGLLTVYNNTAKSGTVVYAEWVFATDVGHTITLDIPCGTGIYVGFDATLANVQVTVSYR